MIKLLKNCLLLLSSTGSTAHQSINVGRYCQVWFGPQKVTKQKLFLHNCSTTFLISIFFYDFTHEEI